jgi:hypothetical protein
MSADSHRQDRISTPGSWTHLTFTGSTRHPHRRRARCKGAARQQLEQLGMVCLYNALVWRADEHQLAAPEQLLDGA